MGSRQLKHEKITTRIKTKSYGETTQGEITITGGGGDKTTRYVGDKNKL